MTREDAPTGPAERRAQARSIATRDKLVRATLDVIHERGYRAASTKEFAGKAGVSRGALLHHFPTRSDITVAAMETLLREATQEIRAMAHRATAREVDLDELLDFLWTLFSGRFFHISVEFINEARTDAHLREVMIPVVQEFHTALDEIWIGFDTRDSGPDGRARILLNLTACLMRGMGVQTVLKSDPSYFEKMLATWKTILPKLLDGRPPSDGT